MSFGKSQWNSSHGEHTALQCAWLMFRLGPHHIEGSIRIVTSVFLTASSSPSPSLDQELSQWIRTYTLPGLLGFVFFHLFWNGTSLNRTGKKHTESRRLLSSPPLFQYWEFENCAGETTQHHQVPEEHSYRRNVRLISREYRWACCYVSALSWTW